LFVAYAYASLKTAFPEYRSWRKLKILPAFVFQTPGTLESPILPLETTAEDRLATKRLEGLLDYVEALVKLDERPATRLAQHKLADGSQFALHQHEIVGLPGLSLDGSDNDGPIWLRIERLQRTVPPQPEEDCRSWIDVLNDPTNLRRSGSCAIFALPKTKRTSCSLRGMRARRT
jgi:hypothetical protein